MTTSNNAVTDIEMPALSLREEIALEIHSCMDTIGQSYLIIGKGLVEARGDFDKQADFLAWTRDEFGIMKSQAFNLMKVAKVFGDDARFAGVAMRVLSVLARYVEDAAVMGRAEVAASKGTLDSASLALILEPAGAIVPATPAPTRQMAANDGKGTEPQAGADKGPEVAPEAPEIVIDGQVVEATPTPAAQVADQPSDRERGLLSMIETLKETIQQMQDENRKRATERDSRIKAAPMLPQFKSKCLYARLGLSLEESQDVKKVKKAQRDLVKLGYSAEHEAWASISEAVEALTAA